MHNRPRPIIYRDIKPANILVSSRAADTSHIRIKLSDFGLAKEGTPKTHCGTEQYAAPEIMQKKGYTPAVDIWFLGVVVLELAHGLLSRPSAGAIAA